MTKRTLTIIALVAVCGASGLARQSALAKTGVPLKDIQAWAMSMMYASTASDGIWLPTPAPTPAVLKAIQAMSPAEKLALTQEVLAAVKATITSPAFRAEHTARIAKQTNKAVDHGIDVNTYGVSGNMQADMIASTVIPMIQMMRGFPAAALQNAFEQDRAEQAEKIKEETGEERAKAQKYLAQLNALAPLMKSNPEEFKKQYTLAKSALAGGPDTEAKLQAASASGKDKERIRLEQTFYNRYKVDSIMRKNLTKFLDQATQMDFKSPTRIQDGVMYWNDGNDMFALHVFQRLVGPAATTAAIQFAQAWLKELK